MNSLFSDPTAVPELILTTAMRLVSTISIATIVLVALDLVWARFYWRRELRMTKQEVKDEFKQAEGDPLVKARLRSLARDRARTNMLAAVPRATLVIANPTHYAIALKYKHGEDAAPTVLAKGQDLIALKIRELAEQNNVPVVEDKMLARSMYDGGHRRPGDSGRILPTGGRDHLFPAFAQAKGGRVKIRRLNRGMLRQPRTSFGSYTIVTDLRRRGRCGTGLSLRCCLISRAVAVAPADDDFDKRSQREYAGLPGAGHRTVRQAARHQDRSACRYLAETHCDGRHRCVRRERARSKAGKWSTPATPSAWSRRC